MAKITVQNTEITVLSSVHINEGNKKYTHMSSDEAAALNHLRVILEKNK